VELVYCSDVKTVGKEIEKLIIRIRLTLASLPPQNICISTQLCTHMMYCIAAKFNSMLTPTGSVCSALPQRVWHRADNRAKLVLPDL